MTHPFITEELAEKAVAAVWGVHPDWMIARQDRINMECALTAVIPDIMERCAMIAYEQETGEEACAAIRSLVTSPP